VFNICVLAVQRGSDLLYCCSYVCLSVMLQASFTNEAQMQQHLAGPVHKKAEHKAAQEAAKRQHLSQYAAVAEDALGAAAWQSGRDLTSLRHGQQQQAPRQQQQRNGNQGQRGGRQQQQQQQQRRQEELLTHEQVLQQARQADPLSLDGELSVDGAKSCAGPNICLFDCMRSPASACMMSTAKAGMTQPSCCKGSYVLWLWLDLLACIAASKFCAEMGSTRRNRSNSSSAAQQDCGAAEPCMIKLVKYWIESTINSM
jgi:hypothetical protein